MTKLKCIRSEMGKIGPVLEVGKIYTEVERTRPTDEHWQKHGGRVVLAEMPRLEWYADRFVEAA